MKIDISNPWAAGAFIISVVCLIVGQATWQTTTYQQQLKANELQANQTQVIKESQDDTKESMRAIAGLVHDHEARLKVNESHINDLRDKAKK